MEKMKANLLCVVTISAFFISFNSSCQQKKKEKSLSFKTHTVCIRTRRKKMKEDIHFVGFFYLIEAYCVYVPFSEKRI